MVDHWRLIKTMPSAGFTDTLDDAKREFASAWRAWLSKTGKDEETHGRSTGRR
jgi:hypothetical protein